jgi:hypothetical protein
MPTYEWKGRRGDVAQTGTISAESKEAASRKKYSRRDFLVTGGTVVPVDALIAMSCR